MLGWMAWTWPTALLFVGIFSAIGFPDGARAEIPLAGQNASAFCA